MGGAIADLQPLGRRLAIDHFGRMEEDLVYNHRGLAGSSQEGLRGKAAVP